jgi:folate-binding protein YgfZ
MYQLRAKVEYTDLSDKYMIVYSSKMPEFITIASHQDPRYDRLGVRSIVDKAVTLPLSSQTDLYFNDKYNFAIPDGDIDLIQAKSIPIEYGAEELNALSYSKGCYIGQEVISLAKYQGMVRKKIFKVSAEINLSYIFTLNAVIIVHCENIGILFSSYKNQGIALIREEKYSAIAN